MRTRARRRTLLIVMFVCASGAAWSGWDTARRLAAIDRVQRDLNERVDRLSETLDAVTTAEQRRTAAANDADPAAPSRLIEQIRSEVEGLRPHLRSIEAGRALLSVSEAASTLRDVDQRAREHIRLGQDLMAADLLSSDGRSAEEAITKRLAMLRKAETEALAAGRAEALDSFWTIAGAVAVLWALGLILLARQPPAAASDEPGAMAPLNLQIAPADTNQGAAPPAASIDLQAAADVCADLARMTDADGLPRLLQRAAVVLNASGVVVWMAAGEELFAAAAFGYPPQVVRRLGPINRAAVNATADAWRSGTLQAVAGEGAGRSALAAPMLGPDRCIGVLAVEVGAGLEQDAPTRAVATLFAAQLTAALAAWPAASAAAPLPAPPLERAAEA